MPTIAQVTQILQRESKRLLTLKQAINLVWRSAPRLTIANIGLLFVQGVLPLIILYLTKLLFDTVSVALVDPNHSAILQQSLHQIFVIVAAACGVALLGIIVGATSKWISEVQVQSVMDYVFSILHAKSIELDLAYYENADYYNALHRAQAEAPYRPTSIINGLMQIGQSTLSLVVILGLLISLHWGLTLILIATMIPGILIRIRYAGMAFRWLHEYTAEERQSWYFHYMLTDGSYAKEVRLFNLGPVFVQRFRALRTILRTQKNTLASQRALIELVTQGSLVVAVFAATAFIAYRTLEGHLTVGDLVMYYQAFQRGQSLLYDFMRGVTGLYEDTLFLSSLDQFLALSPQVANPAKPIPIPTPIREGIAFENVQFHYPNVERSVLNGINLTIKPGQIAALVGENGQGKTTLIKLLCRLYDPTDGRITLDGVDLRDVDLAALRHQISIVFQDYVHYNLSVEDNIWFGNVEQPPDREQVIAAAKKSGIDSAIQLLKDGYDTTLGKLFQDGAELSIGQWQKIALARAFLRTSPILILDEPTSALDAIAEFEVFQQFRQLVENRTAILISHRLSTVKMADVIYVIQDGQIVEAGSHDELMARNGYYAHLFKTQAQSYNLTPDS